MYVDEGFESCNFESGVARLVREPTCLPEAFHKLHPSSLIILTAEHFCGRMILLFMREPDLMNHLLFACTSVKIFTSPYKYSYDTSVLRYLLSGYQWTLGEAFRIK